MRKHFASMSTMRRFDYVVIGSGQSGSPLATALAKSGKKTALVEREHIGGTCVNVGCTPTKTMIASGRVAYMAGRAKDYGVWTDGKKQITVAVEMEKVRQRKRDIVESFRGGSERRVKGVENLEVLMGEGRFKDEKTLSVKMNQGDTIDIQAEIFFINTGERPAKPEIPGLDQIDSTKVLNSTSVMELGEVPERLVVLGGGYIGMEFGQLFRRLGSQVHIVQSGKQLVPREDPDIAEAVMEICKQDGIEVSLNTSAISISAASEKAMTFELTCKSSSGETFSVTGSHLLLAAGRIPNTDMLNLSSAGVETDSRGHIKVSPSLQTSVPHIYALGDVHGGPAFTHVSYDDFRILKHNLLDKKQPARGTEDRTIPYVVYTDPQLGHVGLHEAEARSKYPDRKIMTAGMPMAYVARALETDETRGLMKAVVDGDSGEILGFTCLGLEGGEVMSVVQTAMLGKLEYWDLQNAVYAHPTLAESLNNLWGFLKS